MMSRTRKILLSACLCALVLVKKSEAQSIIDPADPVVEYDPAHPPTPPDYFNPLVKWVRTLNIANGAVQYRNPGWNSDVCKAYSYNGLAFRVQFPKTYNPTANDGKKYPLIIFLHGQGENDQTYLGPPPPGGGSYNYDNQYQLLQGPPQFDGAIQNGQYDGYVLSPQLQNNVSSSPTTYYFGILNDIMNITKYMIANNKVDPFHIVVNGLSVGGVGVWNMLNSFPTYVSAAIPMSSPTDFVDWSNTGSYFSSKRFTPIWTSQGGLDTHPSPAETQRVADTMKKWGANFRESLYPDAGHSTWYQLWGEPDFWPFVNKAYSSNPWMIGGPKTFVPGQAINETLGITAGFSAYEWRKDGNVISGATGNTLNVTATGVYDARVQRDGAWSDWSHVPVTIRTGFYEAEDYSNMSGVQKETTQDVGGGQDLGYIDAGDWMDYSVTVSAAGTYGLSLRIASPVTGQLQVKNSSGTVLATVSVPVTGGWQSWQTVSTNITLNEGTQTIRIYASTGGWNFNWMQLTAPNSAPPPPPPPSSTSLHVEAENYVNMSGIVTESTTDAGGGQDVGYIDAGDWMDYNITTPAAANYAMQLRIASPGGGQVQIRNSAGSVLGTVSIPVTGGWQNWQTVTSNMSLPAGAQTLRLYAASGGWNINWFELDTTGTSSGGGSTGTSTTRIEAENYTSMTGVQKETTQDVGGGQNVGYIDPGDWMDYAVNVSAAGTYTVNFRLASPNSGGQLQLKNGAGTVLATVNVPTTGAWQNWQTVSASVTLPAGTQTLRIYDAASGWNINWFELTGPGTITTSAPPPPPPASSNHIEAENYSTMSGVIKESTTDTGGGLDVGYIDTGDWMDYSVSVSSAGSYVLNLRLASPNGAQLQVRNSSGTVLSTVTIPATGGWQNWQTVSTNVALSSGTQTIRIYASAGGWNFNWMEFSGTGTVSAASTSRAQLQAANMSSTTEVLGMYPNPVTDNLQLRLDNDRTGRVTVLVYNISGALQKQISLSKPAAGPVQFNLSFGQMAKGSYIIKVIMDDWTASRQISKL